MKFISLLSLRRPPWPHSISGHLQFGTLFAKVPQLFPAGQNRAQTWAILFSEIPIPIPTKSIYQKVFLSTGSRYQDPVLWFLDSPGSEQDKLWTCIFETLSTSFVCSCFLCVCTISILLPQDQTFLVQQTIFRHIGWSKANLIVYVLLWLFSQKALYSLWDV